MIYEDVFRALQEAKIRYIVVGGMAINFHGILRATADLDLMVQFEDQENVQKFAMALKKLGFKPRVPIPAEELADPNKRRQWQEEKGAVVFTFIKSNSFDQVDVFLKHPIEFKSAYARCKRITIGDIEIPVASLKDLKTMKNLAGREKDLADIKHIEKLENLENEAS